MEHFFDFRWERASKPEKVRLRSYVMMTRRYENFYKCSYVMPTICFFSHRMFSALESTACRSCQLNIQSHYWCSKSPNLFHQEGHCGRCLFPSRYLLPQRNWMQVTRVSWSNLTFYRHHQSLQGIQRNIHKSTQGSIPIPRSKSTLTVV